MQLTIELPFPAKELFPNFKRSNQWYKYSRHIKTAKLTAWGLTLEQMNGKPKVEGWQSVKAEVIITPPDNRRRDADNLIGACKAFQDGIAQAVGVDDYHWVNGYQFKEPEKPGYVEFRLELKC